MNTNGTRPPSWTSDFSYIQFLSLRKSKSSYPWTRPLSQSRTILWSLFFCTWWSSYPRFTKHIFKEIHQDLGKPVPTSGNLDRWVAQGVFPLNSVLTVRAHETGSHRNMGWEIFTDAVIRKLSEKRENLIFMLWGSYAKEKLSLIDSNKHLVLTTVHPSPALPNMVSSVASTSAKPMLSCIVRE